MRSESVKSLELKVPPVAVGMVFAGAMWLASRHVAWLALPMPWRVPAALLVACAGLALAAGGVLAFRRAATTVNPMKPRDATSLVTSGVYRLSRNPMYAGALLGLAAWAIYLSHALAFLLLPAFVAYMNRFQIAPEERALAARFGDAYEKYRTAVRRWL